MEEHFETFCKGKIGFGPFWDDTVGYWKESLEKPHSVVFEAQGLEGRCRSTSEEGGRVCGTSILYRGEKKEGVIQEIAETCSLRKLKYLQVNKSGKFMPNFENRSYFRKGEVGDWVNNLSPPMIARLHSIMEEKKSLFGLEFKTC